MTGFVSLLDRVRLGLSEVDQADPSDRQQAAVLIMFQDAANGPEVVLTRRADHMRLHPGEIAFPGGRRDDTDRDEWHTALRENEEELAVLPAKVQRLGQLERMITRTGIEVTPCVGYLAEPVEFVPNPEELSEVFTAPLSFFANANNLVLENMEIDGRSRKVPHYLYETFDIWGVTAFMLVRLANIGHSAGFNVKRY